MNIIVNHQAIALNFESYLFRRIYTQRTAWWVFWWKKHPLTPNKGYQLMYKIFRFIFIKSSMSRDVQKYSCCTFKITKTAFRMYKDNNNNWNFIHNRTGGCSCDSTTTTTCTLCHTIQFICHTLNVKAPLRQLLKHKALDASQLGSFSFRLFVCFLLLFRFPPPHPTLSCVFVVRVCVCADYLMHRINNAPPSPSTRQTTVSQSCSPG